MDRMKRGRRQLRMLAVAALAASCFPATASADHSHYQLPAGEEIQFSLPGTNGYKIEVRGGSAGGVTVSASGLGTSTKYSVHLNRPAARAIHAKLGDFGAIDVHFSPHGPSHLLPRFRHCDGPPPTVEPGSVSGSIHFVADEAFTSVDASKATAYLGRWVKQRCRYGEPGRRGHHEPRRVTASLFAAGREPAPYANLEVLRFAKGGRPAEHRISFSASTDDSRALPKRGRAACILGAEPRSWCQSAAS
jgi:hypothetical protein